MAGSLEVSRYPVPRTDNVPPAPLIFVTPLRPATEYNFEGASIPAGVGTGTGRPQGGQPRYPSVFASARGVRLSTGNGLFVRVDPPKNGSATRATLAPRGEGLRIGSRH